MVARLAAAVAAGALVLALIFVAIFGLHTPCGALADQYRRVGEAEGGAVARLVLALPRDLDTDGMDPLQCVRGAVQLRLHGASALPTIKQMR